MTLYVVRCDVLAGEEEQTWKDIKAVCRPEQEGVDFITMSTCQTSSDINVTLRGDSPEALAVFILDKLCPINGVTDLKIFMLLQPRVFTPFTTLSPDMKLFTLAIDANPRLYKDVYTAISELPDEGPVTKTFLAYTFQSYDDDILLNFVAPSVDEAYKYVTDVLRTIPGVSDTKLFYQARGEFLVPEGTWTALSSEFVDSAAPEEEMPMPSFVVTGL